MACNGCRGLKPISELLCRACNWSANIDHQRNVLQAVTSDLITVSRSLVAGKKGVRSSRWLVERPLEGGATHPSSAIDEVSGQEDTASAVKGSVRLTFAWLHRAYVRETW